MGGERFVERSKGNFMPGEALHENNAALQPSVGRDALSLSEQELAELSGTGSSQEWRCPWCGASLTLTEPPRLEQYPTIEMYKQADASWQATVAEFEMHRSGRCRG